MVFLPIEEPDLSLLGDSASHIVSVAPISMAPFASQLLVEITYIDSSKLYKSIIYMILKARFIRLMLAIILVAVMWSVLPRLMLPGVPLRG